MKRSAAIALMVCISILLVSCASHNANNERYDDPPILIAGLGDMRISIDPYRNPERVDETIKIGITHASHDNVGQILHYFGNGVDFMLLDHEQLNNLEQLRQFYAIFINCGSHHGISPRILRSYVEQGGIVYASDLAATPLAEAFGDIFDYANVSPSLTVRNAEIVHSTLASHMGVGGMDIEFNMGGWNVVTQMSSGVTTYIQGYIPNHGISPLAISFTYGEGTVFFTSFHNNAQATDAMINFIEYLVFRIKFIEADRTLQYLAQSHGFDYSGAVFGFFTDATARTADAATMSPNTSFETDFSTESAALSSSDFVGGGFNGGFRYNFAQGVDFLLMVDSGGQDFTLVLHDPDGNIFHITQNGEVYIVKGNPSPVPAFEAIGGLGIRISGGLGGYWTFYVMSENVDETASFAIGIATQSQ